ncbi:MAG: endonuclease/exonuclease/phosphatase family protein [Candidatus Wallbacteria bacterium]|nr:endonuclease/exonuclease/phosphatase family protein [Candidatus Wallbacteria bacterium]
MESSRYRISRVAALAALVAVFLLCSLASAEPLHVRVAAANLSSGDNQSYDPGHGIRILQALKPDVVLIQEFRYAKGTVRDLVDQIAGKESAFYHEDDAQLPNGVISRFPIRTSGCWTDALVSNRDFAWADIQLPGGKDLWAVSVHLHSGGDSVELRNQQAAEIVKYIKEKVPVGQYLVIGGDFNTQVRGEDCLQTLGQVIVNSGPYPADQSGNGGTSANRSKPYDWVLASPQLQPFSAAVTAGGSTLPGGLVFDSRVFTPLDTVTPAQQDDSAAKNMQHMAVVRDFVLP